MPPPPLPSALTQPSIPAASSLLGYTRLLVGTEKTPARTLAADSSLSAFFASADFRSLICFQTCGVWRPASLT
ncbi:hypothetical protein SGRIM128S_07581 [Streptomyces griseomycini]